MKRTKKKNQLGKGKSGFFTREFGNVPDRCTFTSKDINIGKNALDSLLRGAFFLKGESSILLYICWKRSNVVCLKFLNVFTMAHFIEFKNIKKILFSNSLN